MARERLARRKEMSGSVSNEVDVGMGDVAALSLPPDVPQNPDGSPKTEGEVTEDQAKTIGALTLESAAKNKANARKMKDKMLGKTVRWNCEDAVELFWLIKNTYAAEWNSLMITVSKIDPGPKVQYQPIQASTVKDPGALYQYVEGCHGQSGIATYLIAFRASSGSERGSAKIYMPDRSAPPVVQVMGGSQQSPQAPPPPSAPQYAPYGYGSPQQGGPPPPPGYGAPPAGYGGPPPGYWPTAPQQQQPPQQSSPQVIVVSPPAPHQPSPQPQTQSAAPVPVAAAAPAPPPPPQHVYMHPPAPAPGAWDPQRAMIEMMQAQMTNQSAQLMTALEKITEKLAQPPPPPPPPGFIPLPSDNYPMPRGFVRIPGGMIPDPTAVYAPQGVGAAPAAAVATAAVPAQGAAQPVVIQNPPPPAPVPFDQQVAGTVKMFSGVMRGFKEMESMFSSLRGGMPGGGEPEPEEIDEPPPAPNPIVTQEVGGITMAIHRDTGKTDWPATLMGAIPKVVDAAKSGLAEYQKMMDRQAQMTQRAVQDRIALARAVAAAQQPPPPPAALPPAQQPPPAAPPPQTARPPQAAPRPAAPVRKTGISLPNGPLWGTSS
jgi:hypothetical protein